MSGEYEILSDLQTKMLRLFFYEGNPVATVDGLRFCSSNIRADGRAVLALARRGLVALKPGSYFTGRLMVGQRWGLTEKGELLAEKLFPCFNG